MCSFSYYELLDGRGQDIIHSVPHGALLATGNKYMLRFLEEYGVGEGVEITKYSLVREARRILLSFKIYWEVEIA